MHRSRLFALIIDTPSEQAAESATFWAGALAASAEIVPGEEQFTRLVGAIPDLAAVVQAVDDPPRYHLDIETDDVEAEVARLTALGAVEVSQWLDCHVLRAPGGHLVCVIPVHSDAQFFAERAHTWRGA